MHSSRTYTESDHYSDEENKILDAANSRFISTPDTNHEFSYADQIGLFQVRGTYISVHTNQSRSANNSKKYIDSKILLHSERNRLRLLCDLMMTSWQADFVQLLELVFNFESGSFSEIEEWEAESFGLQFFNDSYQIGSVGAGHTPVYLSRDLLLVFLYEVCKAIKSHQPTSHLFNMQLDTVLAKLQTLLDALETAKKNQS